MIRHIHLHRQTWCMEFFTAPDISGALGGEVVKLKYVKQ